MAKSRIYIMSDDEFNSMNAEKEKESFLDSLLEASKNNGDKKFTSKNMKRQERKKSKSSKLDGEDNSDIFNYLDIPEKEEVLISDDKWDNMLSMFDEISPIDDIAEESRFDYRRHDDDEDYYQQLFKKERSMMNDVLADLQKRSKAINTKINSMSGKGAYGVSKNYVELVDASTTMDKTKLDIIKSLADLKMKAADLRLKEKRLNPEQDVDDNDSVADAFYKQIIGGGNKDFLKSSVSHYAPMQQGIIGRRSDDNISNEDDIYNDDIGFNPTMPIYQQIPGYEGDDISDIDPGGYIRNEKRNVQIVVQRYPDGNMRFAAIDEDGIEVDDYELPNSILLSSLETKPTSSYAHDRFDRKYRIVDVDYDQPEQDDDDDSTVSLDDLDDDSYDNIHVDKYGDEDDSNFNDYSDTYDLG